MCGIACVAGGKKSAFYCYEALEKLEYRGYDSAGMAGIEKNEIRIFKEEGMVKNIQTFAKNFKSNFVISHTRWATHGGPNKHNAHPHLSYDEKFAIVHNGIIENYQQIKENLINKNINFVSETDSECICNYIASQKGKTIDRIKTLFNELKGSYAVGLLDKENKRLIGFRKQSPLYVAKTTKGIMLASDIMCFIGIAKDYYPLEEKEIAVITNRRLKIYNSEGKLIKPKFKVLNTNEEALQRSNYDFFMEKEINEIPAVIKRIATTYSKNLINEVLPLFENIKDIKLVGCGTAYHASMYGSKVLEKAINIPCNAYIASELKYSPCIANENTLAIFVSQSGETADTLGCVDMLKKKGAKTLGITNVEHSLLAQKCDKFLPVLAGKEIAVASTKAYIAQILVFYILSRFLKNKDYNLSDVHELTKYAKDMIKIDEEIINLILNQPRTFFIGRQLDSVTALESALKLKEITYKSAEGYPAGELKHGTIALIEENTPVIVFATGKGLIDKTITAGEEVKARGAKIILCSTKSDYDKADYFIKLPENINSELLPILSVIPFQVLAFEVSKKLGYNPDKPRNLAKSVTVE